MSDSLDTGKIYVRMSGRLGNQLFRYAVARSIQEQTGAELVFDWRQVVEEGQRKPYEKGFKDSLKYFQTHKYSNGSATVFDWNKGTLHQKILFALAEAFVRIGGKANSIIMLRQFAQSTGCILRLMALITVCFITLKSMKSLYMVGLKTLDTLIIYEKCCWMS